MLWAISRLRKHCIRHCRYMRGAGRQVQPSLFSRRLTEEYLKAVRRGTMVIKTRLYVLFRNKFNFKFCAYIISAWSGSKLVNTATASQQIKSKPACSRSPDRSRCLRKDAQRMKRCLPQWQANAVVSPRTARRPPPLRTQQPLH